MRISDVTVNDAIRMAKEDETDQDVVNDFTIFLEAAKSFVLSYTGLDTHTADTKTDLTVALFVLINEMHDNRSYTVTNDKINPAVKTILNMHSTNLL